MRIHRAVEQDVDVLVGRLDVFEARRVADRAVHHAAHPLLAQHLDVGAGIVPHREVPIEIGVDEVARIFHRGHLLGVVDDGVPGHHRSPRVLGHVVRAEDEVAPRLSTLLPGARLTVALTFELEAIVHQHVSEPTKCLGERPREIFEHRRVDVGLALGDADGEARHLQTWISSSLTKISLGPPAATAFSASSRAFRA